MIITANIGTSAFASIEPFAEPNPPIHRAFAQASVGINHTLAIDTDGGLWAYGNNSFGQLGDGSTIARNMPTQININGVMNDLSVIAVSAGDSNTIAIDENGGLWAWGNNHSGQIGDGTSGQINNRSTPVQINTDGRMNNLRAVSISAGVHHTMAIDENGGLWAWGSNNSGQLGDGSGTSRLTPVQVNANGRMNNLRAASVSAGLRHTMAIDENGGLWSWGDEFSMGISGGFGTIRTPMQVNTNGRMNNFRIALISVTDNNTMAIDENGNLWGWGSNINGSLGDGTSTMRANPVQINTNGRMNNLRVVSVSSGNQRAMAIDENGDLWGWGAAPLGDGITTNRNTPVQINIDGRMNNNSVSMVSVRAGHIVAIDESGNLWAWGLNSSGQLGDGTTTDRLTPIMVAEAPLPPPIENPVFLTLIRQCNTFNVNLETIEFEKASGWWDVGYHIPNPTGLPSGVEFRGWALRPDGEVMFLINTPLLLLRNQRLYAVYGTL